MGCCGKDGNKTFEDFHLKIELTSKDAKLPQRATPGDAGMDVFSPIDCAIGPRGDVLIPLDWKYEMPDGYALIFKEKSGVATKLKLDIGACVCDAQYRGIVHIHLFNNSDLNVRITKGQKIAQFIIVPVWDGQPVQVDSVDTNTERSDGGFGSTGSHA